MPPDDDEVGCGSRKSIAERVIGILIDRSKVSDDAIVPCVLGEVCRRERHPCWGIIRIEHLDDERVASSVASRIGGLNPNVVSVLGFEIESGLGTQLIANDHKSVVVSASSAGNQLEEGLLIGVWIIGSEDSHEQVRGILGDLVRTEDHLGRDFVDVHDTDRKVSENILAGDIGGPDSHLIGRLGFEVENRVRKQLRSRNLEYSVVERIGHQRKFDRPCQIRIDRREQPDEASRGGIFQEVRVAEF